MNFNEKVVLITGAAGFIGKTFCNDIAKNGGRCILVDREPRALTDFLRDLPLVESGPHVAISTDLGDMTSRHLMIERVVNDFEKLDILVNNAAYTGDATLSGWVDDFEKQSIDTWSSAIQVNLTACFELSQKLTPLLKNGINPSILNVGSIYGIIGPTFSFYEGTDMGNPAAYAASKGGLIQLTRWLASALGPGIRVNSVSPGGVFRNQPEIFINRYNEKTPLGRMATEQEISNGMLFLVSDLASYVTGHNLVIDGGLTIT